MTKESNLDYKKRVLDTKSSSYCGAKWGNATIWLNSGKTVSCHHPKAHSINLEEIKTNPSAIHNTQEKKIMRKQMQEGYRPSECGYCWAVEDLGIDAVSDRVFKSNIYTDQQNDGWFSTDYHQDIVPKTLELSFSRTCNLACSYCGPQFSTTWIRDIKNNGGLDLQTYAKAFYDIEKTDWFNNEEQNNPYVDAFWRWWPQLKENLDQIRITGGEPLMTRHFWDLLDKIEDSRDSLDFAFNTNLIAKDDIIEKLIVKLDKVKQKKIHMYTSFESYGKQSEYIRDGFDWEVFNKNFKKIAESNTCIDITIMTTLNYLCLPSFTNMLDHCLEWKNAYGKRYPYISFNILRDPMYMSVNILPKETKDFYAEQFEKWIEKNKKYITNSEIDQFERFISYLKTFETAGTNWDDANRKLILRDNYYFFSQYDVRRNKNYIETFPEYSDLWEESREAFKDV